MNCNDVQLIVFAPLDGEHLVGHNKCYEHILVPASSERLGTWMDVRITEVSKFHMMSEIIGEENKASNNIDAPQSSTISIISQFTHSPVLHPWMYSALILLVPVILAFLAYIFL